MHSDCDRIARLFYAGRIYTNLLEISVVCGWIRRPTIHVDRIPNKNRLRSLAVRCNHPDPDLCERLGRHFGPALYELYKSSNQVKEFFEREAVRAKFLQVVAEMTLSSEANKHKDLTRAVPCVHEGRVLQYCTLQNSEHRHVRACDRHEFCTRAWVSTKARPCIACVDYQPLNVLEQELDGSAGGEF